MVGCYGFSCFLRYVLCKFILCFYYHSSDTLNRVTTFIEEEKIGRGRSGNKGILAWKAWKGKLRELVTLYPQL